MSSFPYWQDYDADLIDANSSAKFTVHGEWISCYKAAEEFEISVAGGPRLKFNQGLRMGFTEQQVQVKVFPKAGAAVFPNAIVLRVGVGEYVDARFAVSAPLQIAAGAVLQPKSAATVDGGVLAALAANITTSIRAANASRRCARIRNTSLTTAARFSTNAGTLSATVGELLNPGEEKEIFVTGEIFARSTGTPVLEISEEVF